MASGLSTDSVVVKSIASTKCYVILSISVGKNGTYTNESSSRKFMDDDK